MPEARLDWILEMHSEYPPGSIKVVRPADKQQKTEFTRSAVSWANVLDGKALVRFLRSWRPVKSKQDKT